MDMRAHKESRSKKQIMKDNVWQEVDQEYLLPVFCIIGNYFIMFYKEKSFRNMQRKCNSL